MSFFKLLTIGTALLVFQGCSSDNTSSMETRIKVAKEVVKNRKVYAKEITLATNECIKSATSVQTLTASGNDQEETVIACTQQAQTAYGAYSPYYEHKLQEYAVQ